MRGQAKFVAAMAAIFTLCFADAYLKARDRHRESVRLRDTLHRMWDIATALEKVSAAKGRFPCIRSRADYPKDAAAMLPAGSFVDGWGSEISVRSSPGRYVITSLGSDRR